MPIQYGRNIKSYPPNENYRREWERMFGKKGAKPEKVSSGEQLLACMSKGARERYGIKFKGEKRP